MTILSSYFFVQSCLSFLHQMFFFRHHVHFMMASFLYVHVEAIIVCQWSGCTLILFLHPYVIITPIHPFLVYSTMCMETCPNSSIQLVNLAITLTYSFLVVIIRLFALIQVDVALICPLHLHMYIIVLLDSFTWLTCCLLLKPPNELPNFERDKIKEQKIKPSYPPKINESLNTKIACQNLVRQPHKLCVETKLEANIRNKTLHKKDIILTTNKEKKNSYNLYV